MEAAITASLAAVVGLIIGRLWDSRLEAVRWRRDQRVRVYEHATSAWRLRAPGTWGGFRDRLAEHDVLILINFY